MRKPILFSLSQTLAASRHWGRQASLLLAFVIGSSASVYAQSDYYVSAATGNDSNSGASFASAFATFQKALEEAETAGAGSRIFLTAGVYIPTQQYDVSTGNAPTTADPQAATFKIPSGIEVYGGFVGNESNPGSASTLASRNLSINRTVLSGDFNGDDVIAGSGQALTITNNTENAYHVVFTRAVDNTTIVDGVVITGGYAFGISTDVGAGWFNDGADGIGASNPTIRNTSFVGNYSGNRGAGMVNEGAAGEASPTYVNVTFAQNSGAYAAGAYNDGRNGGVSSPTFTNCVFWGNYARSGGGGAMENYARVDAATSLPVITNCTFVGNYASGNGGAVAGNRDGGGTLTATIQNSIFWGNTAGGTGDSWFNNGSFMNISNTLIEEATLPSGNDNGGNLFAQDPLFACSDRGDLRLGAGSPAINAGNNAVVATTTDIVGFPRITNTTVDMGANEYTGTAPTLPEVSLTATNTNFGSVDVGTPSTQTYTINNTGAGILYITGIRSSNPGYFSVSNVPAAVMPGSTANFDVTFDAFEIGSYSALITVGNGNDCDEPTSTFTVNATATGGTQANALAFDGTDEYVDFSGTATGLPQGNAARTVDAWVKTTQTNIGNIVSWGTQSTAQRNSVAVRSNSIAFIGEGRDVTGTTPINDGEWHHIAMTYDGTTIRLYIDGVLETEANQALNTTGQNLRFGVNASPTNNEYFNGELSEVRIWNDALTVEELRHLRYVSIENATDLSCLLAYYNMTDATGTTLTDLNGGGINGTLTNMEEADWTTYTNRLITTEAANDCADLTSTTADVTNPTVTITTTASNPQISGVIPVTITFDEAVVGFAQSDISTSNGTIDSFDDTSAPVYTLNIIPNVDPNNSGDVTVSVAAAVAQDAAGNDNEASNTLTITYYNQIEWNGTAWSPRAPAATEDVVLTGDYDFGTQSTGFAANNITVNNGAALTITDAGTLTVNGDLTNDGTVTQSGGTVIFSGSTAQSVGGTSAILVSLVNVTLDNSEGLTLNIPVSVSGKLTLTNGTLASGGNLTLAATQERTGYIVKGAGSVSGNVTVQRIARNNTDLALSGFNYAVPTLRYMSSPISGLTVGGIDEGVQDGFMPNLVNATQYNLTQAVGLTFEQAPNIRLYDPNRVTANPTASGLPVYGDKSPYGWYAPTTLGEALPAGAGFGLILTTGQVVSVSGELNEGDITAEVYNTGVNANANGFSNSDKNFLGNPYASPMSLQAFFDDADNRGILRIGAAIPIPVSRDQVNWGVYSNLTRTSVPANLAPNGVIAPMQAFRVVKRTLGTSTLTFKDSHRADAAFNVIRANNSPKHDGILRLNLEYGDYSDEAAVIIHPEATTGFDADIDMERWITAESAELTNLATISDGMNIQLNVLNAEDAILPVSFNALTAGEYSFSIGELSNWNNGLNAYLEDRRTGEVIALEEGSTYAFNATKGQQQGRFFLHLTRSSIEKLSKNSAMELAGLSVYASGQTVNVVLPNAGETANVQILDISGRMVEQGAVNGAASFDVATPAGVYIVRVETQSGIYSKKVVVE